MLESHYAPRCRVLLVDSLVQAQSVASDNVGSEILRDDDLAHYAHTLFSRLRAADDRGVRTVVAVLPPATGLGHAIRDRLIKAAAQPRDER
jgi:L-threonylcarbamoyladenylate synthase